MRKLMLSILMAILMALGMGTVSAMAATTEYDLWVGGVRVTSDNASDITGTNISGKVSYNAGTNTLTLEDATIYSESRYNEAIRTGDSSLNINLVGTNTVSGKTVNSRSNYGMYIRGALTFSGSGSLIASAESCTAGNSTSAAILATGDITVNHGCTITAYCGDSGNIKAAIYPYGFGYKLILNGSNVTAANKDFEGENTDVYNASSPSSYKYLKIEPAVTYTITVTDDGNGSASADLTEAEAGTEITLTATPDYGYVFKEWQVNQSGVTIENNKFTMPTANVEISAVFAVDTRPTYAVDLTVRDGARVEFTSPAVVGGETPKFAEGTVVTFDVTVEDDKWYTVGNITGFSIETGDLEITNNGDGTYTFTMPPSSVSIQVPLKSLYVIDVTDDGNGSAKASLDKATSGTEVTLTATPNDGYVFDKWEVTYGRENTPVTVTDNKFTMPVGSVTVKAYFKDASAPVIPPVETKYTITVTDDGHGRAEANFTEAEAGTEITLTVTPDDGYEFDKWVVVEGDITINANNKFTMPAEDVEINAIFKETSGGSVTPSRPSGGTTGKLNYDATIKPEAPVTPEAPTVVIPKGKLVLTIGSTTVDVFGNDVTNDVAPEIVDGYTMLPGRIVVESLGGFIGWDEAEQRVRVIRGTTTIDFFIGQKFALVNGIPVEINVAPYIKDGRTFIEVRSLVEKLGAEIQWNGETKEVTIISK